LFIVPSSVLLSVFRFAAFPIAWMFVVVVMISSGQFLVDNIVGLVGMAAHDGNSAFLKTKIKWGIRLA